MNHSHKEREFVALDIAVLTVSDSRTEETDKSGKLLADRLQAAGHRLAEKRIVPDDVYALRTLLLLLEGWQFYLAALPLVGIANLLILNRSRAKAEGR